MRYWENVKFPPRPNFWIRHMAPPISECLDLPLHTRAHRRAHTLTNRDVGVCLRSTLYIKVDIVSDRPID